MRWSPGLHFAALLDLYVAPNPEVEDQVYHQLCRKEELATIQGAINDETKGRRSRKNTAPYGAWLPFTGLDLQTFRPELEVAIEDGTVQRALFDLMVGQHVKSFQLNYYTEIHEVRALISGFFTTWSDCMDPAPVLDSLWWDGIHPDRTPHSSWTSRELRGDGDFLSTFERWLFDSNHLQTWLDVLEKHTPLANNPEDDSRVFSEKAAVQIVNFAKVGHPN